MSYCYWDGDIRIYCKGCKELTRQQRCTYLCFQAVWFYNWSQSIRWCWWTLLENNRELCLPFLNSLRVYVWERNKKSRLDFLLYTLETCWLAENQKTKHEISLFWCFTPQYKLFLSPLHFNSPSMGKIISRMVRESKISFWLSFASEIKIWIICHLESY